MSRETNVRKLAVLAVTAMTLFLFAVEARAQLLPVDPLLPQLTFNLTGRTTYDAGNQILSVQNAIPQAILFNSDPSFPPGFFLDGSVTIDARVDNSGTLINDPASNSLTITGTFFHPFGPLLAGTVLTGTVSAFGYQDAPFDDRIDMMVHVTSSQFGDPSGYGVYSVGTDVYVSVRISRSSDGVTDESTFKGSFATGFSGAAVGQLSGFALMALPHPPVANAGSDQSLNENQESTLDGGGSFDPDGDPLSYEWTQVSGAMVTLFGATTAQPTFFTPFVAPGGETLTFKLKVTANGQEAEDTVDITVVNVNHTPVADAGDDQSIAEGTPTSLDGTPSFDIDSDPITYSWTQTSGPSVILTGANTATPSFTAPVVGGGSPGVVAVLEFKLIVDDGFPPDAPASGYTFANVQDIVIVNITNVNNAPIGDAGADETVNENSAVTLNGSASSDPDDDTLTFAWVQVGGPLAALVGGSTATPSLTTPFVGAGGADLTFRLTVNDGYGGTAIDTVVVHVVNANDPPSVSLARPTIACLWPPNHKLVPVGISGVSDADDDVTITIDRVTQDEPTKGLGDGDTAIDAVINGNGTVLLRAERSGKGNGRVYHVHFTASDLEGSASGVVSVCVQHDRNKSAIDGGELFDSTY
jgi:hypothetical protein